MAARTIRRMMPPLGISAVPGRSLAATGAQGEGEALGCDAVGGDQPDAWIAERGADAIEIGPGLLRAGLQGGLDRLGQRTGVDRGAGRQKQGRQGGDRGGSQESCDRFEHGGPQSLTVSAVQSCGTDKTFKSVSAGSQIKRPKG